MRQKPSSLSIRSWTFSGVLVLLNLSKRAHWSKICMLIFIWWISKELTMIWRTTSSKRFGTWSSIWPGPVLPKIKNGWSAIATKPLIYLLNTHKCTIHDLRKHNQTMIPSKSEFSLVSLEALQWRASIIKWSSKTTCWHKISKRWSSMSIATPITQTWLSDTTARRYFSMWFRQLRQWEMSRKLMARSSSGKEYSEGFIRRRNPSRMWPSQ